MGWTECTLLDPTIMPGTPVTNTSGLRLFGVMSTTAEPAPKHA